MLIGGLNEDWPLEDEDEDDRFLPLMDQLDRLAEAEDGAQDDDGDDDAGPTWATTDAGPGNGSHRPRPGR